VSKIGNLETGVLTAKGSDEKEKAGEMGGLPKA